MRKVFLDTETTGLFTKDGHRIIDIACIEMINRKLTGRVLHQFFNPEFPIDPRAEAVHGMNNKMLEEKPKFATIIPELKDFLMGAEVVAHNMQFDMEHVNNELRIAGAGWLLGDICSPMCTLKMAWAMDKVHMVKGYSLDKLKEKYRVEIPREVHGALVDASILAEVYLRFTKPWYM